MRRRRRLPAEDDGRGEVGSGGKDGRPARKILKTKWTTDVR